MPTVKRIELDARTLKVLAHPMRIQILRILQLRKQVSVTSLADELSETTGATSYHLRQLARHGVVEQFAAEGEPSGVGRKQQWWRMAVDEIHMSGLEFLDNPDTREAAGFLLREFHAERSRRLANWFATAAQWPTAWQKASSDLETDLALSPAQARRLADELAAVVAKYRQVRPGRGARAVDVQYAVFPVDTGERP